MSAPSQPFDLLAVLTPASATVWDRATSAASSAPDLATALASLSPRPRRSARVLVATGAFFTQRVALPAARTASLAPAELQSALFYEVEPFCAIPRDRAEIAVDSTAPGEWRVTVADRAELAALRARVQAARCRFAGAIALPPDAPSDPAALAAALFPPDAPPPAFLQPPREPLPPRILAMASAAAILLVALFCAADWLALSARARSIRPALAASEALAAANAAVQRDIQAATDRLDALEAARARREAALTALATRRPLWPDLLSALADAAASPAAPYLLRAISPSDDAPAAVRIQARAATPSHATEAMSRLSTALAAGGWTLHPGPVEANPASPFAAFAFLAIPFAPEAAP